MSGIIMAGFDLNAFKDFNVGKFQTVQAAAQTSSASAQQSAPAIQKEEKPKTENKPKKHVSK